MRGQPASSRIVPAVAALVTALALAVGWLPGMVSPAAAGEVVVCAQKDSGILRAQMKSEGCRDTETPMALTSGGVSGVEIVDWSSRAGPEPLKRSFAKCSAGKAVIAGGGKVFSFGGDGARLAAGSAPIALKVSAPSAAKDGWAVTAEAVGDTPGDWFVTAYAVCADAQ